MLSAPVVIGIILGIVLIAGVAGAYCYHQHQDLMTAVSSQRPIASGYTTTALLSTNTTHITTALEEELIGEFTV